MHSFARSASALESSSAQALHASNGSPVEPSCSRRIARRSRSGARLPPPSASFCNNQRLFFLMNDTDVDNDPIAEVLARPGHPLDSGTAAFFDNKKMKLVLVGNPNVGKSVFFNHLTGLYVDVSNFPGTTVEIAHGEHPRWAVYDTPGIYGVSSFNDEERVARDIILEADIVLNVVDAVHLERDLFLTLQLIDMGKKVAICLNMMDEAKARGVTIDVDK